MNSLGKFSLSLSLLCFLVTFGLKLAMNGWMPFLTFGFGFGFFFLFATLVTNFRYFRYAIFSESVQFLVRSGVALALVLFVIICLNFILVKTSKTIDLTKNGVHSLAPMTLSLLGSLKDDVSFYYFHTGNDRVKGFEKVVRAKLQSYIDSSQKIRFFSHSIFQRPDLAEKFKVGNEESTLFVESGGKIERVSDLKEVDIVGALLRLTKPQQ
ncbi:MAG: hypothetical protein AAF203_07160, partial [Pseudomonadota bacterium]